MPIERTAMFYEDLVDALGGSNLEGTSGYYEGWSPNVYKTILIFENGLLYETHGNLKPVWKPFKRNKGTSKKHPLSVFSLKQFGCLEVLGYPQQYHRNLSSMFPAQTRLNVVMEWYDNPVEGVIPTEFVNYIAAERAEKGTELYFHQLDVCQQMLETFEIGGFEMSSFEESCRNAPLAPNVYALDRKEGELWSLLKSTSEYMSDLDDLDTKEIHSVDTSGGYFAEEWLPLLKLGADKNHTLYSDLNLVLSRFIDSSADKEAYPWIRSFNPSVLGTGREAEWSGVFLDNNAPESENVFTVIKAFPKEVRAKLYPKVSVARDETLEGLLTKLESVRDGFESGDEDSLNIDGAEKFYAGLVQGTVLDVLESYDKIFASGFGVLKPVGVLTETDGNGQLIALSSDGRVIKKGYSSLHLNIWRLIQDSLGLICYDCRDINEMAQIAVSNPDNSYFPYKMLEYAFGRCANTGERDLYPPHSSAKSWGDYKNDQVAKSLKTLLNRVVVAVCRAHPENKYIDLQSEVNEAIGRIKRSLMTCVLVSSYDELNSLPVKVKVRVLTGGEDATVLSSDLLLTAVRNTLGTAGGRGSQTYEPTYEGNFVEFRHETDAKLANVEPLFAYKLLQSSLDAGIPLDPNNAILGIKSNDTIAYSGADGIKMNLHTSHLGIAGSRAGKGLLTQAIQASNLVVGKPVGLADNKPDMSSLMLNLAPASFVVNGSNINSAPDKGDDIFSVFTPDYVRSLESRAQIPDYLHNLTSFVPGYSGTLGTMVYLRYVLLALGILAVRSKGGEYPAMLGGEQGVCFIFDEISNTGSQLRTLLYGQALKTHLLPARYMDSYDRWVEAGKGDKSRPKINANPEDFWYSAVYDSLRRSLNQLFMLKNAGFKNMEALKSDVYLIGQDKEFPISDAGEIDLLLPPPNAESKGTATRPQTTSLLSSLACIGRTDALLGYNPDHPDILNQDPNRGGVAKSKLNDKARNFAYLPDFAGKTLEGAFSGDERVAEKAVYFKPALLFADGSPDGYCWNNSVQFMQSAGLTDIEGVVVRNSDESGNLHSGIGFEGYLNLAGISRDGVQAIQDKLSQSAQIVVESLGYSGSWMDFLLDLRPDWIFSVEDIYRAFSSDDYTSPLTKDFRKVYPECFSTDFGSHTLEMSVSEFESEDTPDDDNWDFNIPDDLNISQPSEPLETVMSPFAKVDLPPDAGDYMPDLELPLGGTTFEGTPLREFQVVEMTPEGFQQALMGDLKRYVGDWERVKSVSVVGGQLILNRTVYRTKVADSWKDGHLIPQYMKESVKTSNIAPMIDWKLLQAMTELRVLSFDSWEFFLTYVTPDLGLTRNKFAPGYLFQMFPKLQAVQIGDDAWDFNTYSKQVGVPSGVVRLDAINLATRVGTSYLSRGRSMTWQYTKDVWKRDDLGGLSKVWRTGMGLAGLATVGATELTGRGLGGLFNSIGSALSAYRQELKG